MHKFTGNFTVVLTFLWAAFGGLELAQACSVCFGKSDADMAIGHNWSVVTLLLIIVAVLLCFAAFFVYLMKRAKQYSIETRISSEAIEGDKVC